MLCVEYSCVIVMNNSSLMRHNSYILPIQVKDFRKLFLSPKAEQLLLATGHFCCLKKKVVANTKYWF